MNKEERKLLLSIGKRLGAIEKVIAKIESPHIEITGTPMPVRIAAASDDEEDSTEDNVIVNHGTSTIELLFKDNTGDKITQKVLVESLYATLKKLCEDNNIFNLKINIDN